VPLFALDKKLSSFNSGNDSKVYLENLAGLYQSIVHATGCRVIIDSSKSIGYAYYLAKTGIIDLYIVHLIRDSRATAYSWLHHKGELNRINPFSTSLVWNSRNLKAEIMGRQLTGKYLRIFYEGFVREPIKTVRDILQTIKVSPELGTLPFLSAQEVRLSQGHMIYGNPDRFKSGIMRLATDHRWRHMRPLDKLIVTFLTWPFLLKYRYSIFMTSDVRADNSLKKSQSSHSYQDFPEPFCCSSCPSPRAHHANGR
jgi:hypothetical protein